MREGFLLKAFSNNFDKKAIRGILYSGSKYIYFEEVRFFGLGDETGGPDYFE